MPGVPWGPGTGEKSTVLHGKRGAVYLAGHRTIECLRDWQSGCVFRKMIDILRLFLYNNRHRRPFVPR